MPRSRLAGAAIAGCAMAVVIWTQVSSGQVARPRPALPVPHATSPSSSLVGPPSPSPSQIVAAGVLAIPAAQPPAAASPRTGGYRSGPPIPAAAPSLASVLPVLPRTAAVRACIRHYESSDKAHPDGDYRAQNGDQWGAYQFQPPTWNLVGDRAGRPRSHPASASPEEQDLRAALLIEGNVRKGRDPLQDWPTPHARCDVSSLGR